MRLKTRLESFENLIGVLHGWLEHIYFLKTTTQRLVLIENAPILGVRR